MSQFYLIIPDVHQNLDRVRQILETEDAKAAEHIIFLGDYFDSFDYDFNTKETCKFLNNNINNEKYTFLLGNHDLHYITKVQHYTCSGWTFQKQSIIDVNLSKEFVSKAKIWKYEKIAGKHFLFSHAGMHSHFAPVHFDEMLKTEKGLEEWFKYQEANVLDSIFVNQYHPLLGAGKDRGGYEKYGGVTWIDWSSLDQIPNITQIVGHSTHSYPQLSGNPLINYNLCLDTNLKYWGRLDLETGLTSYCTIGRVA